MLILKKQASVTLNDFLAINMCTVLYKLLPSLLVNRWRPVLQHLISPEQGVFVTGQDIVDNIFLIHETWNYVRSRSGQKHRYFLFKLDMEKTYDRVTWYLLQTIMQHVGLPPKWIDLILACATEFISFIRWNGHYFEPFVA